MFSSQASAWCEVVISDPASFIRLQGERFEDV